MSGFLSNDYINATQGNYSILIGWIKFELPIVIGVILKAVAILHPGVKTDTIRELLTPASKTPTPPT
ncbi:MAG: hypothetical protein ABSG90_12770 [Dehalococcoidia bacterium]|jgi:hypothetical protein